MKRALNIVGVTIVVVGFALIAFYYWHRNPSTGITLIETDSSKNVTINNGDSSKKGETKKIIPTSSIEKNTKNVSADSIVSFAETLIGVPYKYASINPDSGFDCSGFITYVFNHFNIQVPRSSIDFTNAGEEVPVEDSKKGDLILFTGTDSTEKFVGHMGIITQNDNSGLQFIHSSSGKANGVVITSMSDYYKKRFVKVVKPPLNLPR